MANTPNYNLPLPTGSDSMAAVSTYITAAFTKLSTRGNPTVISAGQPLPQTGTYELYDRVFRADPADLVTNYTYPSSYLLIVKDASWGWHWRPIQQIMSPWVSLPSSIINDSNYQINSTFGLQVAFDSIGRCHWRGAIDKITAGIPEATDIQILKHLPPGLRPTSQTLHTVPVSPVQSTTGKAGYSGCRLYIGTSEADGENYFRAFNTNNGVSKTLWLTGLSYWAAAGFTYSG